MKDLDTWAGNSLATILAGLAIAAGVIGLLVAFGQINEDATNSFQDGMVWMVAGLILGITANVFRREHHVVDADLSGLRQPLSGGSEQRGYDEPRSTGARSNVTREEFMHRDDELNREDIREKGRKLDR
jgi:hypothetical protein